MRDVLVRHGVNFPSIAKWLLGMLVTVSVITLMATTLKVAYYSWMPVSHWIRYHSIVPVSSEFAGGEALYFQSSYSVNRPVDVSWNDVLYCEIDGRWRYMMNYESKNFVTQIGNQTDEWRYDKIPPAPPLSCRLDSTIEVHPGLGIVKRQKIRTSVFRIR